MIKSKFATFMTAAAVAASLGLGACGGQAANSSSASDSTSSSAASSTETSSTADSTSAATTAAATDAIISWQGALSDGTLVDYISSNDGKNGGLVLSKDEGATTQRWVGALSTADDGTITITDDTSKESVSFSLLPVSEDGAILIDITGHGKGAIVPMTATDWQHVAEAEELSKTLGTVINTVGMFEDGSLVVYIETPDGNDAVVVVAPKDSTSASQMKTWAGETTTAADGKETVTDSKTQETFSYTWTENKEDGTITIDADGYGKATLVKMTVADWMLLDEIAK